MCSFLSPCMEWIYTCYYRIVPTLSAPISFAITGVSLFDSKGHHGHDSPHQRRSSVLLPCNFLTRTGGISFLIKDDGFCFDGIYMLTDVKFMVRAEEQKRALCADPDGWATSLSITKTQWSIQGDRNEHILITTAAPQYLQTGMLRGCKTSARSPENAEVTQIGMPKHKNHNHLIMILLMNQTPKLQK
jgi:hypothetical protein